MSAFAMRIVRLKVRDGAPACVPLLCAQPPPAQPPMAASNAEKARLSAHLATSPPRAPGAAHTAGVRACQVEGQPRPGSHLADLRGLLALHSACPRHRSSLDKQSSSAVPLPRREDEGPGAPDATSLATPDASATLAGLARAPPLGPCCPPVPCRAPRTCVSKIL